MLPPPTKLRVIILNAFIRDIYQVKALGTSRLLKYLQTRYLKIPAKTSILKKCKAGCAAIAKSHLLTSSFSGAEDRTATVNETILSRLCKNCAKGIEWFKDPVNDKWIPLAAPLHPNDLVDFGNKGKYHRPQLRFKPHSYNLVILDIRMPYLNGFALYREVRKSAL